jgi:hypothetical protein
MRGAVVALMLLLGTAAGADDLEKARAYFQAGVDAYDSGRYEVAMREFQHSHALSHNAALYFNMAACEEHLNHYQAAGLLLRQYLIERPDADDRSKVEARIKVLETRDDSMKRPETEPTPRVERAVETPLPATRPAAPPRQRVISWVLLGVTGALAVGAIGAGSYAATQYGSLDGSCGKTAAGCSQADRDGVHSAALATDVLIGVAAAAAVATIVLFVVEPKLGHKSTEHAAVRLTPAGLVF